MILYDGHYWTTFLKIRGSVFPKALRYALCFALLSGGIKYLETHHDVFIVGKSEEVSKWNIMKNTVFFGSLSSTLAFFLIFRSSQAYTRFNASSRSMCIMRAQFAEAASSLIAFTVISKAPKQDIWIFQNKVVRLFSMLHALCLEEVADQKDSTFPIIDGAGWSRRNLDVLVQLDSTNRVRMVYQWINICIVRAMDKGILAVPPPILSRVFQEMEKGSIEFHNVAELMAIPFPFPYAQGSVILLLVFSFSTPIAVVLWTDHFVVAFCTTLVLVATMASIEFISAELEMPFGDDPNDLPCSVFQDDMNQSLLMLLSAESQEEPTLSSNACLKYADMFQTSMMKRSGSMKDLEQRFSGDMSGEEKEGKLVETTDLQRPAEPSSPAVDGSPVRLSGGDGADPFVEAAASLQPSPLYGELHRHEPRRLEALGHPNGNDAEQHWALHLIQHQKEMHQHFLSALKDVVHVRPRHREGPDLDL